MEEHLLMCYGDQHVSEWTPTAIPINAVSFYVLKIESDRIKWNFCYFLCFLLLLMCRICILHLSDEISKHSVDHYIQRRMLKNMKPTLRCRYLNVLAKHPTRQPLLKNALPLDAM